MDAKSKAAFINSVAAGESIPCPKCGAANKPDNKFCLSCGEAMATEIDDVASSKPAFEQTKAPAKAVKYVEPSNVFAQGLPEWSIEPPQVMVRRH